MITLLDKTYCGDLIVDCYRDFHEAFIEQFTPANAQIPQDEHGIAEGVYRVRVTWNTEEVPDFTQQAKQAAMHVVPEGSDKVAFMLARMMHMVGAMREFCQGNADIAKMPEMISHIQKVNHLRMQCGFAPLKDLFHD